MNNKEVLMKGFETSLINLLEFARKNPEDSKIIGKKIASSLMNNYFEWKGYKWTLNTVLDAVVSCDEYDYSDIRDTDYVLDVGACVGGFSILASKKASYIWAVEPLFGDILVENLFLNSVLNVNVIAEAISYISGTIALNYDPRTRLVHCLPFEILKKKLEGNSKFTFLKFDAEMSEWYLTAEDLKSFRRIEIEVHNHDGKHDIRDFEDRIVKPAGFDFYTTKIPDSVVYIIHGFKKGESFLPDEKDRLY